MKALTTLGISLGFSLCLAADPEPNSNKSSGVVVVLPASANPVGVEVSPGAMHLPGREYRSGDGWWGLTCAATCELIPAKLSVSPLAHPQYDGDPVAGQLLKFSPPPSAKTLVMFKPFRPPAISINLRAGLVTTYHPGLPSRLRRSTKTAGTMEGEISLPDGQMARFVPTMLLPNPKKQAQQNADPAIANLTLDLVIGDKRQSLGQFSFGIEGPSAVKPSEYVRWAGDLDGDGKLDLIVALNYGFGVEYVLFLSSMADAKQLVGEAGRFNYFPIDVAGC
jgi:hypothetical protein